MDELRLAFRRLTRRPAPMLACVVALGCAIGAAAATWSLISAVLLHPLAVEDPDRLFVVGERISAGRQAGSLRDTHLYLFFQVVRDSGIFEGAAGGGALPLPISVGGASTTQTVYFASHDFFDVLGVRIPLGRGFTPRDDRRGAVATAILSDAFWRRAFAADPNVIGRELTVSGHPVTVIGVVDRAFRGIELANMPALYLPLNSAGDVGFPMWNYFAEAGHVSSPVAWVAVVGRLRPGDNPSQALSQLAALRTVEGRALPPLGLTPIEVAAVPAAARPGMKQFTTLLGATVGLLLLVGCLTVGMLLLVRTEARRDEFAMCLALGASRARLAIGVAVEGVLLALSGGVLSLPIAWWLFRGSQAFQLPGHIRLESLQLSPGAVPILVSCGVAIAGMLAITGVAGAFAFGADVADAVRSRSGATPRVARRRTRAVLVAAQVAIAFVLVTGAGLFARSLAAALSLNPGVETSRLVVAPNVSSRAAGPAAARAELAGMLDRLSANPAIRSAALTSTHGGMSAGGRLTVDHVPREMPSSVSFRTVDERYFRTLGLRVLQGRNFSAEDTERSAPVAIVSDSFARLVAEGGTALGRRVEMPFWRPPAPPPSVAIVGVVSDIVTNVNELEPLTVYFPLSQPPMGDRPTGADVVFRASGSVEIAKRQAASTMKLVDASVVEARLSTFDERMARQMGPQRFGAAVLGSLGLVALLLALLGTYVLAETMAVMRMREMGIRAALGATRRQLAGTVLREATTLVGAGLIAGLAIVWAGADAIRALLYHVQPLDPGTLAAVSGAMLALALAVSAGPALQAARANLVALLRQE